MKLIVGNGILVDPESGYMGPGRVFVEEGLIAGVEQENAAGGAPADGWQDAEILDAGGAWIVPGLCDLHVHFRDPGLTYKEDIFTGCRAAAAGGFTTVCAMPNTKPVVDGPETVKYIEERARQACGVKMLQIGSITKGQKGTELSEMKAMAETETLATAAVGRGICAVSEDGRSVMNSALMLEGIREAQKLGLMVYSHTEDESLAGTSIGEELIVARDIMLADEAGAPIHLCHISTAKSLELIRQAKARGQRVTCETGPHYFTFTEEDRGNDGNFKMNPPLRKAEDLQAVIEALKDGTIDAIATDHAPHSRQEKECGYEKALNGIIGLETSFPVSYTRLVKGGYLSPLELIAVMSLNPHRILGSTAGRLKAGAPADIAVIDVEHPYRINPDEFQSKGRNTPFSGMEVWGKVLYTIADGRLIYGK